PIHFIVAQSPGTVPDSVARIMGTAMQRPIGQPLVVENKPGASYAIGLEYVARQSAPDGYTIALSDIPGIAILPLTTKDLHFDPQKDLQSIITLAEGRIVLGTAAKYPWKSFAELVTQAKATPGKLNYGSSGTGSRMQMEAILRGAGMDVVYIPYK